MPDWRTTLPQGRVTMERMPADQTYRSLSLWLDTVAGSLAPGDPLPGDLAVDVAIAGGGLTGLWTAYYLASAQPGLRIAVCEAEIAGFGASGRNGGWCSALFPASLAKLARTRSEEHTSELQSPCNLVCRLLLEK